MNEARRIGLLSRLIARFMFGVRWQDTYHGEGE